MEKKARKILLKVVGHEEEKQLPIPEKSIKIAYRPMPLVVHDDETKNLIRANLFIFDVALTKERNKQK